MKEFDIEISTCLENGHFRFGNYYGIFCLDFIKTNNEKISFRSDRGVDHLVMIAIGSLLNKKTYIEEAEKRYRYPYGFGHKSDFEYLLLGDGYISAHLVGKLIQIVQHKSGMFDINSSIGFYRRKSTGNSFSQAVENLNFSKHFPEIGVSDDPMH